MISSVVNGGARNLLSKNSLCLWYNIVQINHSQHQHALTQTSIETNHLQVLITHCVCVFTFLFSSVLHLFSLNAWMLVRFACELLEWGYIQYLCVSSTIIIVNAHMPFRCLYLSLSFWLGAITDLQLKPLHKPTSAVGWYEQHGLKRRKKHTPASSHTTQNCIFQFLFLAFLSLFTSFFFNSTLCS